VDARVAKVISIMKQSMGDRVSIRGLSSSVNISHARLGQIFKKETGQSPFQYLKNLRIRRAKRLLRNTFLSIKEVAHLSGLTDVSHFVRAFKKRHGVTPTEFGGNVDPAVYAQLILR